MTAVHLAYLRQFANQHIVQQLHQQRPLPAEHITMQQDLLQRCLAAF
jgi:hypothetical protein